jgi:hypothetical protein
VRSNVDLILGDTRACACVIVDEEGVSEKEYGRWARAIGVMQAASEGRKG